ncbi:hypothetical protein D3C72_1459490 [compost metagenome]
MQHLTVGAIQRPARLEMHHFARATIDRHAKCPAPRLRGLARQGQAVVLGQIARVAGRATAAQVLGRGHAQAPVVGHAHAHQRRIGQVANADRTVIAFASQIHQAVAQVERGRHLGVAGMVERQERRHMAAAKTRRRRDAQMPGGLDAARADAGLDIGQIGEQALAVLQKGNAFVREGEFARGAHQQLDAQALLQRIQAAAHDGGCHAFGLGGGGEAATRSNGDK